MRGLRRLNVSFYIFLTGLCFAQTIFTDNITSSASFEEMFQHKYISISKDENLTDTLSKNTTRTIVQKWRKIDGVLRKKVVMMYEEIIPFVLSAIEDSNLSQNCKRGMIEMLNGIKDYKLWAFRMVDSFGKIPNGLLRGNPNSLGDYDECVSVNVPDHFQGQYCNLDIIPPMPERQPFIPSDIPIPEFMNISEPESVTYEILRIARHFYSAHLRSSVCIPSSCSKEEIMEMANKMMEAAEIDFNIVVPNCEIKRKYPEFSRIEIGIMIALGILFFLAVSSTSVDVFLHVTSQKENNQENLSLSTRYLLCFSFYTNTKKLLKTDTSLDSIKVLHGIRVVFLIWIVLCHTFHTHNYQAINNTLMYHDFIGEIYTQFICNGLLLVQTFFFLSAVLHSYGVMVHPEKKINIPLHIFRRIWRLLPSYAFMIACTMFLPRLSSGPVWKETIVDGIYEKCRKNWWASLTFTSNFLRAEEICLQWSWFLSVDFQLYILSLFVVLHLKSNPRLAFLMNFLMLICGLVLSTGFHIYYQLTPILIVAYIHPEDILHFFERGHMPVYLHLSTVCIGLAVGYFLAVKQSKMHIPLKICVTIWLSAVTVFLIVLFCVYDWNKGNIPNMTVSTVYAYASKFLWTSVHAWVVIACATGNGGFINTFFSWTVFVPLSRLCYMAYLIHPLMHLLYIGSTKSSLYMNEINVLYLFLGNLTLSFTCAFGLCLLFEIPFVELWRLTFYRNLPKYVKKEDILNGEQSNKEKSKLKKEM